LKKNAESFYKNARQLYEQGEYNLAAFNVEQAFQLMLKYLLASKVGISPVRIRLGGFSGMLKIFVHSWGIST